MSDFNFSDFKSARKGMVKKGNLKDADGDSAEFVNHGLDAIVQVKKTFAGVSDNPQSYYHKHPYHSFIFEVEKIKDQDKHLPFHPKDAEKDNFQPTPAKQVREGSGIRYWCALPRVPSDPTDEEERLFEKCLRVWAAIFQVQSALVDLGDVQDVTDEDGAPLEGRLIGMKYKPREYEFEDKKTGEKKHGVTIDVYPYAVDQDTLEKVPLRGAHDVAEYLVTQHNAGAVPAEDVAEMLDYLIDIQEITEEEGADYMGSLDT